MNKEKGFTLIELVMVIVILGILAAVALPKFVDFSSQADQSAVKGIAGALSSANAINYAACSAQNTACVANITNCNQSGTLLQGGLPAGYTITSLGIAAPVGTVQAGCTVKKGTVTASFSAIRT